MLTPRNGKDRGLIVYVDSQLKTSKRFDSEGIKRDYPKVFESVNNGNGSGGNGNGNGGANGNGKERRGRSESGESENGNGHGNGHGEGQLRYWTSDMCSRSPHLFDFVVTVSHVPVSLAPLMRTDPLYAFAFRNHQLGGDGTVLFCSWLFQRIVPPVLPFALGSLGFLTNFDFENYKSVMQNSLDDGIRVNLRMRFTATVYRATASPQNQNSSSTGGGEGNGDGGKGDRMMRKAIKSGKTGEIIMKSIKESGWKGIEDPERKNCLGLKEEEFGSPKREEEGEKVNGAFGKNNERGKGKKDKEVMCFYTRPVETFEVLNDLVVDRGPSPYVSLLEVFGELLVLWRF